MRKSLFPNILTFNKLIIDAGQRYKASRPPLTTVQMNAFSNMLNYSSNKQIIDVMQVIQYLSILNRVWLE